jgi:hypothetical protein
MALINYTNVSVNVGGSNLYANSASYSFQVPMEGVRVLGQKNAIATIPNGAVEGTINIDYIISAGDPGFSIFSAIVANPGVYQGTNVSIGGQSFAKAYLTSHTLSAEANAIVNGSLSFTVFGPGGGPMSQGGGGTVQDAPIGHGSASAAISDAIGFEYNASIEWEPVYILGSQTALGITFRSARQSITARGLNAGRAVTQCPGSDSVTVSVGAICGGGGGVNTTIQNGKLTSSESTVSAGGYVEGSFEIVKEY